MKNKYLHTRNQEVSEETAHSLLNAEESLIVSAAFSVLTSYEATLVKFNIREGTET